ncbi:protein of unknown function [Azospirillum baldaniorum]|uniref:Uncharacterized protein n=1 Tax=Azospirillum baldaniorum TaxID=1064539 RepID=A0A9P1JP47_9PROT|nr:protein of unknown function [Azospirillum baldaniorum]
MAFHSSGNLPWFGTDRHAAPPAPSATDAAKSITANQNINRDLHEYPSMKVGSVLGQL